MNELFVRLFLAELRKAGFTEAAYDKELERVIISPRYSRLYVTNEYGEYLTHYNDGSSWLVQKIRTIINTTSVITAAWEQSTPMCVERFRKLLEWNGIVLAARDDGSRGLHLVTWRCRNPQSAESGNYTTSISGAMRDFAGRSGLVPKERLFNDAQLDVIRSALAYRLGNDGDMLPDDEEKIKAILSALEESDDYEN